MGCVDISMTVRMRSSVWTEVTRPVLLLMKLPSISAISLMVSMYMSVFPLMRLKPSLVNEVMDTTPATAPSALIQASSSMVDGQLSRNRQPMQEGI
ncbi:hypothetical protein DSECCO2_442560 [anaerobic digester metagenome]